MEINLREKKEGKARFFKREFASSKMSDFTNMATELVDAFEEPITGPWDDDVFSRFAVKIFGYQYRSNPSYAKYAKKRGVTPSNIQDWKEIPPVPTLAFKEFPIISGDLGAVETVFTTSGTSRGSHQGKHHILDLSLYRASIVGSMKHHFYSEQRPALLALVQDPIASPFSSLSFMLGEVLHTLSMGRGGFYVDKDNRIQYEKLVSNLRKFESSKGSVLFAGTAFAFVHWADWLEEKGLCFQLPKGSTIMETGGFKGRSRVISRLDLYETLASLHHIPVSSIVSEYGMTEMLSQFYEKTSRVPETGELKHLGHQPPPWLRSLVLDVNTLAPLPAGKEGVLCHFDLANLGSAMAILTEDVGVALDGEGIRLVGRLDGSEERGCSLAMDDFYSNQR